MKLKLYKYPDGSPYGYQFWCPGCKDTHLYTLQTPAIAPRGWTFDGNLERPSFQPSLLYNPNRAEIRCHLYLTDGKLQFLNDCFHELKGQTVDLPDLPADDSAIIS